MLSNLIVCIKGRFSNWRMKKSSIKAKKKRESNNIKAKERGIDV